ncbi:hypothetical protein OSB04_027482 [Centaurea solstitialis]|uniref:Uncharacterized protein n=1 Tax=Centaurea solstitialis TaxID=347529 RepID=A0AA38SS77_9ASTR|nr:hypothetical protein OSB04_027482 [Centaurea solstitialis]
MWQAQDITFKKKKFVGTSKLWKELMEGENGKEVRKKVEEIGEGAKKAMAEGGSSWRTLNELIHELQSVRISHENKTMSTITIEPSKL